MIFSGIILYMLATIGIGLWSARKVQTTRDYVLAGRQMPMVVAAAALFATWFGAETMLGASSAFLEGGLIHVIEDPFGAALCLMLTGAFFARKLYKLNVLTFNDFYKNRFGRLAEFISALFMIPSYFGWIAAQLVAMALIFQTVAGIPFAYGIIACSIVVVIYTYYGGMWAVAITDFIQTCVILVGLLVLLVFLWLRIDSLESLQRTIPDGFFSLVPEGSVMGIAGWIAAWITIGLGSIPQQDIFQRVMSARSPGSAVTASWLSGWMYLTIGMIPLVIVLFGQYLYPVSIPVDGQAYLLHLVLLESPLLIQLLFFGALTSAIMSTTSGAMLAPATVLAENIIRPRMRHLQDHQVLRIIRWSVLGVAAMSAMMAFWKANIYELVAQSSALSLVSLFVPLTAGLYWRKSSAAGAILSMICGMAAWLIALALNAEFPAILIGLGVSIAGMIAGSLLIPDGTTSTQQQPRSGAE